MYNALGDNKTALALHNREGNFHFNGHTTLTTLLQELPSTLMMEFELKTADPDATKDVNIDVGTIQLHFTAEEEKRVVRKIDCFILPLVRDPFL